ncbi:MAG: outer membrane protein transport protein [Proteobacteria bacterium]|nr:outer membrane protein transport protein [Pseudomonadota bacterium]
MNNPGNSTAVLAGFAGLCAMVMQNSVARGNPVDSFGFGARAAAMAGAQTAASNDGGAHYYNPAIVAAFDRIRIDLGYQFARPALTINGLDVGVDASRGLTASLSVPGRVAGRRVAIGGGLFLPDQHLSRTRTLSGSKPRFVIYDNRPQRLFIAANLSLQIARDLFVGGGLAYMSSTRGSVLLDGRVGFPNAADSDLALDIDVDLETIRYPQAGILYRAAPWLDIGFSYRGGFKLVLDQIFIVQGDVGGEGIAPLVEDGFFKLHTVSQDLFQPAQVSGGLVARISPSFTLAFDLEWQRWSEFDNPAAQVDIELDVGQFNDLVDIPEAPSLPEANFRDILIPRVAIEWAPLQLPRLDLQVRAGYAYEASPVPDQIGETNFVDNDKHTMCLGAGVVLRRLSTILAEPLSLDLFVAVTALAERTHAKLSPADPVGDYRSDGYIVQTGVSSRWRF